MAEPYEQVVLVGGPHDGREIVVPVGHDVWGTLAPPTVVEYRLRRDHGWPARQDDGRLVFEMSGTYGGPMLA